MKVYTYSDPFRLKEEKYWDEISASPNLCVSQTLVQGLTSGHGRNYSREDFGFIYTVESFINKLYKNWTDSPENDIKQYVSLSSAIEEIDDVNLRRSFKFNQREVMRTIKMLIELNLIPENFELSNLTREQQELIKIYKKVMLNKEWSIFVEYNQIKIEDVKEALIKLLNEEIEKETDEEGINNRRISYLTGVKTKAESRDYVIDKIVFQGIHRFSPMILKLISDLERLGIEIIAVINYLPEYEKIYETWRRVYSWTGSEFIVDESRKPNIKLNLGEAIGELMEGETCPIELHNIRFTKFDNLTSFCDYVSSIYKVATEEDEKKLNRARRINKMNEQFYAVDNEKINDVLKQYHPEQFRDRHFLAYPIGQFILSIYNMWDSNENVLKVDARSLKECLSTGFFQNDSLINPIETYRKMEAYYENLKLQDNYTIDKLIENVDTLIKNIEKIEEFENVRHSSSLFRGFSLYNMTIEELEYFKKVLNSIKSIVNQLFKDGEKQINYRDHYKRLLEILTSKNLNYSQISKEEKAFVDEIRLKFENLEQLDIVGTVDDLKESLHFYLNRRNKEDDSNWIVRNFEQLDGGVMLSRNTKHHRVYHIALVGDNDMKVKINDLLPWPLEENFFLSNNLESYRVNIIMTSLKEYRNFLRYSLFYATYYLKNQIHLSYIENSEGEKNKPYFILEMLGLNPVEFDYDRDLIYRSRLDERAMDIIEGSVDIEEIDLNEMRNFVVCKYRFLLDELFEKNSYYENEYLQKLYYEVLLLKKAWEKLQGRDACIIDSGVRTINESLKKYFFLWKPTDFYDIENKVIRNIEENVDKSTNKVNIISEDSKRYLEIRIKFIYAKITENRKSQENLINEIHQIQKNNRLTAEIKKKIYGFIANEQDFDPPRSEKVCDFCKQREVCLYRFREV